MRYIVLTLVVLLTAGFKGKECKPYFDFDTAEHYHIDYSNKDAIGIDDGIILAGDTSRNANDLAPEEKQRAEIVMGEALDTLSDTVLVPALETLGFSRKVLSIADNKQLSQVLCKKRTLKLKAFRNCGPIYRDILVLRKHSKIVGVIKICFSCNQIIITGAKIDTWDFGLDEDYKQLEAILHPN